jgi:TPR repeat protein
MKPMKQACSMFVFPAMLALGVMALHAETTDENWFKKGNNYFFGLGVQKSYAQAAEYYRKAAEAGHAKAQAALGELYEEGFGVPLDLKEATKWYLKASDQNDATAQFRLAQMYETGKGRDVNVEQAIAWYERAANNHHLEAQLMLGKIYSDGLLSQQVDLQKAAVWFLMSAQDGNAESSFRMGELSESGKGVKKDLITAYAWYHVAAVRGYKGAFEMRDKVGNKLNSKDREAALAKAVTFESKPYPGSDK